MDDGLSGTRLDDWLPKPEGTSEVSYGCTPESKNSNNVGCSSPPKLRGTRRCSYCWNYSTPEGSYTGGVVTTPIDGSGETWVDVNHGTFELTPDGALCKRNCRNRGVLYLRCYTKG